MEPITYAKTNFSIMKQPTFLLLLMALLSFPALLVAQPKAKFSGKTYKVQKTQLPQNFVDENQRTYRVYVKGRFSDNVMADARRLHGWQVDNDNPNLKGVISIYGYNWKSPKVESRKRETKDKDGKVTDRWTEYSYSASVIGKGSLYLYGISNPFVYTKQDAPKSKAELRREAAAAEQQKALAANPFLSDEDVAEEDEAKSEEGENVGLEGEALDLLEVVDLDIEKNVKTDFFRSRSAAYKAYRETLRPQLVDFVSAFPDQIYRKGMRQMNYEYGYAPVNNSFAMKTMKTDKHPEAANWNNACTATKTLFNQFSYNESIESKQPKFDPIVAYFQEQLDGISEKDRKGKKMKKAAFKNLSNLLFYLDRHDDLVGLAKANQESKMLDQLAERWLRKADRQRALMEFHGLQSCHIVSNEDIAADEIESGEDEEEMDDDGEDR